MDDTVRARTAGVRARRQWLTPLQRRHRHGSPSVRVAPVAVPLTGSARVQVASSSPCGPDSSDPFAWPCSTRSPAGKPPAKPVAAQEVSCPPPGLRLGLGQVARARRFAPGAFDGGSRWPARQLGQAIPTTVTSRRCLSFGTADGWTVFNDFPQPQRPCQVARASPFVRDASATTAARLGRFDLLRLPCITLRRLH